MLGGYATAQYHCQSDWAIASDSPAASDLPLCSAIAGASEEFTVPAATLRFALPDGKIEDTLVLVSKV